MNRLEQTLQTNLCSWMKKTHPDVIFKVDSGASQHKTSFIERNIYEKQQWKSGYPDFQIIQPSKIYAGLFLELKAESIINSNGTWKRGSNDHYHHQHQFHLELIKRGYFACFVCSLEAAQAIINGYLMDLSFKRDNPIWNGLTALEKNNKLADDFFNRIV